MQAERQVWLYSVTLSRVVLYLAMSGFCDSARALQNFAQNRSPCTEFGVLRRIEENLPNGTENAKIFADFC